MYCKLCPKQSKYSGNTTNMRYHLENCHKAEFKLLQQSEKEKKSKPGDSTQPTVKGMLEQSTMLSRDSSRWNNLIESGLLLFSKRYATNRHDTVNDKGFRATIKTFEPRYTPLDKKRLQQNTCLRCTKLKRSE